jgi:hypothetical protein
MISPLRLRSDRIFKQPSESARKQKKHPGIQNAFGYQKV